MKPNVLSSYKSYADSALLNGSESKDKRIAAGVINIRKL